MRSQNQHLINRPALISFIFFLLFSLNVFLEELYNHYSWAAFMITNVSKRGSASIHYKNAAIKFIYDKRQHTNWSKKHFVKILLK